MASEGPREPAGEGIKLSADVKPFVPKFAGLSVAWSESSETRVFPSCAATTYYPCVQELAVPEQKLYTEGMAFGASTFPPQYLSSEITLHPYAYPPYTLESSQNKKTYDEQRFDSKKTDGPISSDLKSVKGSHPMSIHAESSLKSDRNSILKEWLLELQLFHLSIYLLRSLFIHTPILLTPWSPHKMYALRLAPSMITTNPLVLEVFKQ